MLCDIRLGNLIPRGVQTPSLVDSWLPRKRKRLLSKPTAALEITTRAEEIPRNLIKRALVAKHIKAIFISVPASTPKSLVSGAYRLQFNIEKRRWAGIDSSQEMLGVYQRETSLVFSL